MPLAYQDVDNLIVETKLVLDQSDDIGSES